MFLFPYSIKNYSLGMFILKLVSPKMNLYLIFYLFRIFSFAYNIALKWLHLFSHFSFPYPAARWQFVNSIKVPLIFRVIFIHPLFPIFIIPSFTKFISMGENLLIFKSCFFLNTNVYKPTRFSECIKAY